MTFCPSCGAAPCINPSFCWLCHKADRELAKTQRADPHIAKLRLLMPKSPGIERAQREMYAEHFRGRAAASTVEALMWSLRERGTNALAGPNTRRRLSQCSDAQLVEVGNRLQRLKPQIGRSPWSANEVRQLIRAR